MSEEMEERTFRFSQNVRNFCRKIKWDLINAEDIKQLIKASGSVGSNYIEANENLGIADEKMKIKICRKEAKESAYWLRLLFIGNDPILLSERNSLVDEANQYRKIFTSILMKINSRPLLGP